MFELDGVRTTGGSMYVYGQSALLANICRSDHRDLSIKTSSTQIVYPEQEAMSEAKETSYT